MVIRKVLSPECWVLSLRLRTQDSGLRTRLCVGQATTEFILVLGILTLIGIFLMSTLIGPDNHSGAVGSMAQTASQVVQNDPD